MFGFGAGRAFAYIVAGWLGLLVVASLQAALPAGLLAHRAWLPLFCPSLGLLVVIYAGLMGRGNLAGVCALAAVLGYLADLVSGSPRGVYLGAFLLVALALRGTARLLVRGPLATAMATFGFTLLAGVLVLGLRRIVGLGVSWGMLRAVPLEALATAIASPFGFRMLARIDRLFSRMPPPGRDVRDARGVPASR